MKKKRALSPREESVSHILKSIIESIKLDAESDILSNQWSCLCVNFHKLIEEKKSFEN